MGDLKFTVRVRVVGSRAGKGPHNDYSGESQLLKGDRREQTGLRNIRPGRLSWKQITEAVSTVWDQE
jgi:hypothetical protein